MHEPDCPLFNQTMEGDWVTENVILHSREWLLCRIMLFCTLDGRTNLFCTFEQKVKIQGGGPPRVHLLPPSLSSTMTPTESGCLACVQTSMLTRNVFFQLFCVRF